MVTDQAGTEGQSRFGIRVILLGLVGLAVLTAVASSVISLYFLAAQEQDAPVINIAGRQRMLSQKMTKESLTVASQAKEQQARQELSKTRQLFDTSLNALINGNVSMGVPKTEEPKIVAQLATVSALWRDFNANIQTIERAQVDDPAFQNALIQVLDNNGTLLKQMNAAVQLYETSAKEKVGTLKLILYAGICGVLIVFVVCWITITRLIIKPVQQLISMIKGLEAGHLDQRLQMNRGDEIGVMAATMDAFADNLQDEILTAFKKMSDGDFTFEAKGLIREPLAVSNASLNESMGQVQMAAEQISGGADQISDTSQQLSQAATEQASSLEEITSSMTEMGSRTKQNADNAVQVNQLTGQARQMAEKGNRQMHEMVEAMSDINHSAQDISKIIKVIDEIAFQTNLLALNAAVEAAHAGQHGKGFSVVAEEVGNLAARSAKAANETASLIEVSVAKAGNGSRIAEDTAGVLGEIVTSVSKVSDLVNEISASSDEQAQGISQISIGLSQIDEVTQQNTSNAVECAATSEELAAQANDLREMLARFTLSRGGAPALMSSSPMTSTSAVPTPAYIPAVAVSDGAWGGGQSIPSISLDDDEFCKF